MSAIQNFNIFLPPQYLETVLKPLMDNFTHLFPFEKFYFKSNKNHYSLQNKDFSNRNI
jgi:hypothetical protein